MSHVLSLAVGIVGVVASVDMAPGQSDFLNITFSEPVDFIALLNTQVSGIGPKISSEVIQFLDADFSQYMEGTAFEQQEGGQQAWCYQAAGKSKYWTVSTGYSSGAEADVGPAHVVWNVAGSQTAA